MRRRIRTLLVRASSGIVLICFTDHFSWSPLAVAAHLALYNFDLRTQPGSLYKEYSGQDVQARFTFTPLTTSQEWDNGVKYASAQNVARTVRFQSQFR